jgi:hypothetical protein
VDSFLGAWAAEETTAMEYEITASNARPSTCITTEGAYDVDVSVTIDGKALPAGEVTLAPRQYDGELDAYGNSPDHWISGALLKAIVDRPDFRELCGNLVAEAAAICE